MTPSKKLTTSDKLSPHKYAEWMNSNMRADDPRCNCSVTLRTKDAFFDIEGAFFDFKWPYIIMLCEHYPPVVVHVDEVESLSIDLHGIDWWNNSVERMHGRMEDEDYQMIVPSESVDEWLENADEPEQDVPGRKVDE